MAATRTPAKLELVETMCHRFWLPANARIAASRYGQGSGKKASGSAVGQIFIRSDSYSPGLVSAGEAQACIFIQTEDCSGVTKEFRQPK